MKHRGECAEGPRVFTELERLQNAGKPECVKLPGRRPERPETAADDLTKKPVCRGSASARGVHPATEKQQAYGRFWLAQFRESKTARLVGREARMAEIFHMLTDGVEVSCLTGLAASAWKPCLGDGPGSSGAMLET